jgi:hypothetical protein
MNREQRRQALASSNIWLLARFNAFISHMRVGYTIDSLLIGSLGPYLCTPYSGRSIKFPGSRTRRDAKVCPTCCGSYAVIHGVFYELLDKKVRVFGCVDAGCQ